MTQLPPKRPLVRIAHLRGALQLVVEGVQAVTHIAQGLHGSITRLAPPLGRVPERPAGGIAGFVYRTVRGGTALVGRQLDAALAAATTAVMAAMPPYLRRGCAMARTL